MQDENPSRYNNINETEKNNLTFFIPFYIETKFACLNTGIITQFKELLTCFTHSPE